MLGVGLVTVSAGLAALAAPAVAGAPAGPVPGDVAHPIGQVHLEDYEWFNILQVVDASNRVVRTIKIAGNPLIPKPPLCHTAGRARVTLDYTLTWELNWFTRLCSGRGMGTHDIPINRFTGARSMNAADLGKPPFHGGPLSHGCLRMAAVDARYVYDHLSYGVPVYFVETSYRPYGPRPPSAPALVHAAAGNHAVRVTWTQAAMHGALVSAYQVTLSPGGRRATVSGSVTAVTFTGLSAGVRYAPHVRAMSARGASPWRAGTAAAPYAPPGAPVGLRGEVGSNGVVYLVWSPAAANGSPVRYEVRVAGLPPVTVTRGPRPTAVTGLPTSAPLHLELLAVNAAGAGPPAALDLPARPSGQPRPPRVPLAQP